jgi:negative regulator of sigma E activity
MNGPDLTRDPPRDPEIAAWLSLAANEAVGEVARLEPLRQSIRARAVMPLARLRQRPHWWEVTARWARPAIPMAAAASLALAVLVGNLPTPANDALETAGLPYLEEVLAASLPSAEYELLAFGGSESEALLRLAVEE